MNNNSKNCDSFVDNPKDILMNKLKINIYIVKYLIIKTLL